MSGGLLRRLGARLAGRLRRDDRGAALVEYAVTMALFFLLFFAILDFGRLLYNWVMTEKAMQMAARLAVVRPPVCTGVPETNLRGTGSTADDRFGTACGAGANMCAGEAAATATCSGSTVNAAYDTGGEIWTKVAPLMPAGATRANLTYTYSFDPDLNFMGGPYVPMVTVELTGLTFQFVSPLLGLGNLAAGRSTAGATTYGNIPFPSMSVSLPGEDLALGTSG